MSEHTIYLSHLPPSYGGTAKVLVRWPNGREEVIDIGMEPVRLEAGTTILVYYPPSLSVDLGTS